MVDTLYRILNHLLKNKATVVERNLLAQTAEALRDDYIDETNKAILELQAYIDGQIYFSTPITNTYDSTLTGNSLDVDLTTGVCTVSLKNYQRATLEVYKNGRRMLSNTDYLPDNPAAGVFTFLSPPLFSTDIVICTYYPYNIVPTPSVPIVP